MKFDNSFEVPLPPAQAWALLQDVQRIAPCMPGAELTEVIDARSFKGRVAVKLGPVALTFAGTARFEELDDTALVAKVKAQGTDQKGRGGANAVVGFALAGIPGGTRVDITTDVTLSGAVAQYGRGAGIIQAVAAELIGQFSERLRAMIAQDAPATAEAPAAAPPPPPEAVPIGGFGLLWRALMSWLRSIVGRG
ncbi:SRPBCC family protein [Falsiroseomonas sp.]|uniref:SRPBCC family protein n=1 Tax=Falsiroseomonas sp. TaxID=2870721 RepID=UPI003F713313